MLVQWAYGGWIELVHDFETDSSDTVYIAYTKPSGVSGYWEAEYRTDSEGNINIAYLVQEGDIDEWKEWTFEGVLVREEQTFEMGLRTLPFVVDVAKGLNSCEV